MRTFFVVATAIIVLQSSTALAWFGGLLKSPINTPKKSVQNLKDEILSLAKRNERGLIESPEDRDTMAQLFANLEQKNPNKASLSSPQVNGVWELQYTTSDSILGRGRSPRVGPIFQTIDAPNGYAKNSETVQYFGFLNVPRAVTAAITPMSPSKCAVQFKQFSFFNALSINCPPSFKGELDVTYVDEDLRLSRGDKGNIFVLTRYSDL